MKLKSVLLLAVALGCGLVAMLGVQQILSGSTGDGAGKNVTKVLVATAQIVPGARLTKENSAFRAYPTKAVPPGAVTKPEEYDDRALQVRTGPGEIIMKAKLGEKGAHGIASDIPPGMRVITVQVDATMTLSGLLLPGNRVDVLVTYTTNQPGLGTVKRIRTALEYIEVFATDNVRDVAGAEEIKAKNVSLLVTPEEAAQLKLAEDIGKLHLSLRPQGDSTKNPMTSLFDEPKLVTKESGGEGGTQDVQKFLDKEESKAKEEPQEEQVESTGPKWTVEVWQGNKRTIQEFALPVEPEAEAASVTKADGGATPWLARLKGLLSQQP